MNKCSKCGAEFEGNFCPECGAPSEAPKVCPKCGATLKENIKFCNNCGYSFFNQTEQNVSVGSTASAKARSDWKENKILRTILLYAPLAIFALWAVLMFAFMAAPVMNALGAKLSVYGFFKSDNVSDDDLAAIVPAAGALLAFSLVSLLYAGWLAYLQFKGGRAARWLSHYASALLYVIVLICTSVIAVKFNKYAQGVNDIKGSFVGVTVAFTVIFLLLHAGALVGCKLLHIEDITDEERAKAKQRFDEWVERCKQRREAAALKRTESREAAAKERAERQEAIAKERAEYQEAVALKQAERREIAAKLRPYKHERRIIVKQRIKCIKTEPFMRGRSTGAMSLLVVLCVVIGIGLCSPVYVSYMWQSYNEGLVDIGIIGIFGITTLSLGLFGCIASFHKKLHKSTLLGWLTVLFSCLLFVAAILLSLIGNVMYAFNDDANMLYWILMAVTHWGMFPLAVIFAFCNVFILADDAIKARKRFSREYDEQKSAEGDVIALKLISREKPDDKADLTETSEDDGE